MTVVSSVKTKGFRRNALLASVGNFSLTIALAIILVSIARFADAAAVGRFSYALAACAPLFLLASLRLRDISATESKGYSVRDYFTLALFTNSLALLLVFPVCLVLNVDRETFFIAVYLGIWKGSISISEVVYGYHQRTTQMKKIAFLQLMQSAAAIISFAAGFYFSADVATAVLLVAFVHASLLFLIEVRSIPIEVRVRTDEITRNADLRKAMMVALSVWPLGVGAAIFSLNMLIPRKLLEEYFSMEQVGIFAALAFCARLGTPIMQAVGQTASAGLAKSIHQSDEKNFAKFTRLAIIIPAAFGFLLAVAGAVLGPPLIQGVYGKEFEVSSIAVVLVMCYAALIYSATLLTFSLIAARWLRCHLLILIATVCTGLGLGIWLIPKYGILGACISLSASAVVRLTGTLFAIRQIGLNIENSTISLMQNLSGSHGASSS